MISIRGGTRPGEPKGRDLEETVSCKPRGLMTDDTLGFYVLDADMGESLI